MQITVVLVYTHSYCTRSAIMRHSGHDIYSESGAKRTGKKGDGSHIGMKRNSHHCHDHADVMAKKMSLKIFTLLFFRRFGCVACILRRPSCAFLYGVRRSECSSFPYCHCVCVCAWEIGGKDICWCSLHSQEPYAPISPLLRYLCAKRGSAVFVQTFYALIWHYTYLYCILNPYHVWIKAARTRLSTPETKIALARLESVPVPRGSPISLRYVKANMTILVLT